MRIRSNGTKEAETAEDYLLLEIERLKEENEKLKKEVEQEKQNHKIEFMICGLDSEEYIVKTKYGRIILERLEKKEKEEKIKESIK